MKAMTAIITMLAAFPSLAKSAAPAPSPEFLKYWKSGLAELSSYATVTERYGEKREGQAVLIFVYEEMSADTRIKVESGRTPSDQRIPVLKLNNVLKFTTGIYDYSVMTSVFAGLSGPGVGRFLEPRKISFSSQEWCGNVYHQLIPEEKALVSEIHSYFEKEGDAKATLPYPSEKVYYEDEIPILIRELDGDILKAGGKLEFDMVPSLWETRKRHIPLKFEKAILMKGKPSGFKSRLGDMPATSWTLQSGGTVTTYRVQTDPPRRLLAWENNRGEKAEILGSLRKTYWELNGNEHRPLRKELKLDYGAGPEH